MLSKNDIGIIQKIVEKTEERLSKKIDKVQETVDIIQEVMVTHHTKLEKRVEKIEDELHISHN